MIDERVKRSWHTMAVSETRLVSGLSCYQVQAQLGKVRGRKPECRDWRWKTWSIPHGDLIVERIK